VTASALIVTHNSAGQIEVCIEALRESELSLCIVDNASADETVDIVRRLAPDATLVGNCVNVGFAAAVNQGLALIDDGVVILVNPDCVLPRTTVKSMLEVLTSDPDIGIVGPQLRDVHGRLVVSAHPFETVPRLVASRFGGSLVPLTWKHRLSHLKRRRSDLPTGSDSMVVDVDWLSGACLAMRTEFLRSLGGLDSGYFLYYEDEELCMQARLAGTRVVQLIGVEAVHSGGASSDDPAHLWPHLYRSLLRFHRRNNPRRYQVVRLVVLARAALGLVLATARMLGAQRNQGRQRALAWIRVARLTFAASDRSVTE
jgi:GT2 family glycosyltransferase